MFSPDADSVSVAKKAWDWLFNPVGFDYFKKEIKDKKIMLLQNRSGFTYSQDDPQDDIFNIEVFRQFVKDKNEFGDSESQLRYGYDIDVVKYVNGKRHTINPSVGNVESALLFDFLDNQGCSLRLSRPHEYSDSLAKLLCLGDELFENDTGVNVYITPYPKTKEKAQEGEKKEQGFAPHYDDVDTFLL